MKEITFHCNACGSCCTHLLDKGEFGVRGLYLQKNEKHLFPNEHVKPMYATIKGKKRTRLGEIFAYQLNLDTCPHQDPETKKCKIYSTRPNVCQSFPIEPVAASRKCPVIAAQLEHDEPAQIRGVAAEQEANLKHLKFLRPYLGKGGFFFYNLETGTWQLQQNQRYHAPSEKELLQRLRRRLQRGV